METCVTRNATETARIPPIGKAPPQTPRNPDVGIIRLMRRSALRIELVVPIVDLDEQHEGLDVAAQQREIKFRRGQAGAGM